MLGEYTFMRKENYYLDSKPDLSMVLQTFS